MAEAKIIDGRAMAQEVREDVAKGVAFLQQHHGITPGLAVVLVGDNPASQIYIRNKGRATTAAGMKSFEHRFDASFSEKDLLKLIETLNSDDNVNGILVQLPLPDHIDDAKVISAIAPEKDVDGFHVINAGLLATGGDGLVPGTPLGCLMMVKKYAGKLSGKNAFGRSYAVYSTSRLTRLATQTFCVQPFASVRHSHLPRSSQTVYVRVTGTHLITQRVAVRVSVRGW